MFRIRNSIFFYFILANYLVLFTLRGPLFAKLDEEIFQKMITEYKAQTSFLAEKKMRTEYMHLLSADQLVVIKEITGLTPFEISHPVVIRGREIPQIIGMQMDHLSLMVIYDGRMQPILFQMDDVNKEGFFYDPKSRFSYQGTPGMIDDTDEIVFMYRDTGSDRYSPDFHQLADGTVLAELQFSGKSGNRYVYLVKNNPLRAKGDYVSFGMTTGTADTTFYYFESDPDNILDYNNFKAKTGNMNNEIVIDNISIELSTGIFTDKIKIHLDSRDNIKGKFIGMNDGPVRATAIVQFKISYAKIPLMNIYTQYTLYDESIYIPIKLHVPGSDVLTKIMKNPKVDFILDWRNMQGAKVAFSGSPKNVAFGVVDGKMSEFERQSDIDTHDNWMWMDTGRGWNFFAFGKVPAEWEGKVRLVYEDNAKKTTRHEKFPGALPNIGFSIPKFDTKSLDVDFLLSMTFALSDPNEKPESFYKEINNPPRIDIRFFDQIQ